MAAGFTTGVTPTIWYKLVSISYDILQLVGFPGADARIENVVGERLANTLIW